MLASVRAFLAFRMMMPMFFSTMTSSVLVRTRFSLVMTRARSTTVPPSLLLDVASVESSDFVLADGRLISSGWLSGVTTGLFVVTAPDLSERGLRGCGCL